MKIGSRIQTTQPIPFPGHPPLYPESWRQPDGLIIPTGSTGTVATFAEWYGPGTMAVRYDDIPGHALPCLLDAVALCCVDARPADHDADCRRAKRQPWAYGTPYDIRCDPNPPRMWGASLCDSSTCLDACGAL